MDTQTPTQIPLGDVESLFEDALTDGFIRRFEVLQRNDEAYDDVSDYESDFSDSLSTDSERTHISHEFPWFMQIPFFGDTILHFAVTLYTQLPRDNQVMWSLQDFLGWYISIIPTLSSVPKPLRTRPLDVESQESVHRFLVTEIGDRYGDLISRRVFHYRTCGYMPEVTLFQTMLNDAVGRCIFQMRTHPPSIHSDITVECVVRVMCQYLIRKVEDPIDLSYLPMLDGGQSMYLWSYMHEHVMHMCAETLRNYLVSHKFFLRRDYWIRRRVDEFQFYRSSVVFKRLIKVVMSTSEIYPQDGGLGGALSGLLKVFSSVNDPKVAADHINDVIANNEQLKTAFSVLGRVESAALFTDSIIEALRKAGPFLIPLLTVLIGYYYKKTGNKTLLVVATCLLFSNFYTARHLIEPIFAYLQEKISQTTDDEVVPVVHDQAFMVTEAAKLIGLILMGVNADFRSLSSIQQSLARLPSTSAGIETFIVGILDFVGAIASWIAPTFANQFFGAGLGLEAREWYDQVVLLLQDAESKRLLMTQETLIRVRELIGTGRDIIKKSEDKKKACQVIVHLVYQLEKISAEVANKAGQRGSLRARPVVTLLKGESGVGKSNCCIMMARQVTWYELQLLNNETEQKLFKSDDSQYIFFKSPDKFNDGMTHRTLAYINDDWGQINTSKTTETPGMDFIQSASEQKYTPRMANVETKNMISANYRYMFLSTNANGVVDKTVNHVPAIGRRFDFIFEVTNDPSVEKGHRFTSKIYRFKRLRYVSKAEQGSGEQHTFEPVPGEPTWSYEQVLAFVVKQRNVYETYFKESSWELDTSLDLDSAARTAATIDINNKKAMKNWLTSKLREKEKTSVPTPDETVKSVVVAKNDQVVVTAVPQGAMDEIATSFTDGYRKLGETIGIPAPGYSTVADYRKDKTLPLTPDANKDDPDLVEVVGVEQIQQEYANQYGESKQLRDWVYENFTGVTCKMTSLVDMVKETRSVVMRLPGMLFDWEAFSKKFEETVTSFKIYTAEKFSTLARNFFFDPIKRAFTAITDFFSNIVVRTAAVAVGVWVFKDLFETYIRTRHPPTAMLMQPNHSLQPPVSVNVYNTIKNEPTAVAGSEKEPSIWTESLEQESGGGVGRVPGKNKPAKPRRRGKYAGPKTVNRSQGLIDSRGDNAVAIMNKVKKNIYTVSWRGLHLRDVATRTDQKYALGYAVNLFDDVFVMNDHFFDSMFQFRDYYAKKFGCETDEFLDFYEHGVQLIIEGNGKEWIISEPDIRPLMHSDSDDICIFKIEKGWINKGANILKHFITDAELATLKYSCGKSFGGMLFNNKEVHHFTSGGSHSNAGIPVTRTYVNEAGVRTTMFGTTDTRTNVFQIPVRSTFGDCGSVLMSTTFMPGKLLGLHCAGDNVRMGWTATLTKDRIFSAIGKAIEEDIIADIDMDRFKIDAEFVVPKTDPHDYHGQLDVEYITRNLGKPSNTGGKTKLVRFEGGPGCELPYPRRMTEANIEPTQFAKNHGGSDTKFTADPNILKACKTHLAATIKALSGGVIPIVFSLKDVMLGVPGTAVDALSQKNSPGYPDNVFGVKRTDYFYYDEKGCFRFGPKWDDLKTRVQEILTAFSSGCPTDIPWVVILKDEKQKIAKHEAGRTRWISCAPLHFQIITMMYYGGAIDMIKRGAVSNGFLTGIDASKSGDWSQVVDYMTSVGGGRHCGSADFTQFDKNTKTETLEHVFDVLDSLYIRPTIADQMIRAGIRRNIIHSVQIYGSVVEQFHGFMPSGCRLTYELNCIQNLLIDRYTWVHLHQGNPASLTSYSANVHSLVCGDDKIWSVSDNYKGVYTEAAVANCAALFGQTMTAADKGPCGTELTPLENHVVLKRGFKWIGYPIMGWVGPLEKTTIEELPLWSKRSNKVDAISIAQSNVRSALEEASLHGEEYFLDMKNKWQNFYGAHWKIPEGYDEWTTVVSTVSKIGSTLVQADGV